MSTLKVNAINSTAASSGGLAISSAGNVTGLGMDLITPTSIAYSGGTASATGGAVSFSGVSSVSLNGVFSSTYTAYRLMMFISSSDGLGFNMRMRASGTDDSSTQYRLQQITADGTTLSSVRPATGTFWSLSASANSELYTWDMHNPAVADRTLGIHTTSVTSGGEPQLRTRYLIHTVNTAYDGFSLIAYTSGQTVTGTVRVYGYKN